MWGQEAALKADGTGGRGPAPAGADTPGPRAELLPRLSLLGPGGAERGSPAASIGRGPGEVHGKGGLETPAPASLRGLVGRVWGVGWARTSGVPPQYLACPGGQVGFWALSQRQGARVGLGPPPCQHTGRGAWPLGARVGAAWVWPRPSPYSPCTSQVVLPFQTSVVLWGVTGFFCCCFRMGKQLDFILRSGQVSSLRISGTAFWRQRPQWPCSGAGTGPRG